MANTTRTPLATVWYVECHATTEGYRYAATVEEAETIASEMHKTTGDAATVSRVDLFTVTDILGLTGDEAYAHPTCIAHAAFADHDPTDG